MSDLIEVSYTGDILAHRRCARAWAFEKYAGFHPYEQVQAMEGRLLHHAMEWLTRTYRDELSGESHATAGELREQLEQYFRVLWARGIRTAFVTKQETLDRVIGNLFPGGVMRPTVKAVIEGAQHSEYELRAVRQVLPARFGGKSRILITGVVDLVVQQENPSVYQRVWVWGNVKTLEGHVARRRLRAATGDLEIWDFKGTRAKTQYLDDYVRQVLTYAALYRERVGRLPDRCVLFFVNEPSGPSEMLAVEFDADVVEAALAWTQEQVGKLRETVAEFEQDPRAVTAGDMTLRAEPEGSRITEELRATCTTCGQRFDCTEYRRSRKRGVRADVDALNVLKN